MGSPAAGEMMNASGSPRPFSVIGGPLHRAGRRLGLVRGETNTILLGLALGWVPWLLVAGLALIEGVADRMFSMALVAGHARLLLVIPLIFVSESWVAPRMAAFVATIARYGVVPPDNRAALDAEVSRTNRWANWWWPEIVCLVIAVLLDVTGSRLQTYGESSTFDPARNSLSFFVYVHVGLLVFRFLVFRTVWKLALWGWFLWRVSRLDLDLIAGHPDRAGGLGSLEGVHERFTPLVAALSVLECAALAESISAGTLAVTAVYPTLAMLLLLDGVLFLGPLLVFTDKLWAGRTKGVGLYNRLAARYVSDFEAKWLEDSSGNEPLLGTPDLQSLADLANAVGVVKGMRWVTIGPRLLTIMTVALVGPLMPLFLFRYPLAELAQKFFSKLVGF
jgi:hypothetical protein